MENLLNQLAKKYNAKDIDLKRNILYFLNFNQYNEIIKDIKNQSNQIGISFEVELTNEVYLILKKI